MSWEEFDIFGNLDSSEQEETSFFNNLFVEPQDDDSEDSFIELDDLDFSSLEGKNFKKDFRAINKATKGKKIVANKSSVTTKTARPTLAKNPKKSLLKSKVQPLDIGVKRSAVIKSKFGKPTTQRIVVPDDRKVIVEGVDKFILSNTKESDAIRNIGYYEGEKLKELVLIITNNTPNDFDVELFNPSSPLDYLYSTSQNLNNYIAVAGDNKTSYSDMLFNLLANPTLLPNAKFTCTNPLNQNQAFAQFNQPLIFKNKNIAGHEFIHPIQNALNVDIDQNQDEIIYWDIIGTLGRVFIPDGMDVIQYKVLAGNQVVFGFYYKQVSLKRFFFKEARNKKIL
jgi:hypothetical protein